MRQREDCSAFIFQLSNPDCCRTERQIGRDAWGSVCAHCVCRSTMPVRELSANISEETTATQLSKFEPSA